MSLCVSGAALKGRADSVFDRCFCLMCGVFFCARDWGSHFERWAKWTRKYITAGFVSGFHTHLHRVTHKYTETTTYSQIDVFLRSLTSASLYLQHPWQVSGTSPSHWAMAACYWHKESGYTVILLQRGVCQSRNPTDLVKTVWQFGTFWVSNSSWEDHYHSHIYLINMKQQPAAG